MVFNSTDYDGRIASVHVHLVVRSTYEPEILHLLSAERVADQCIRGEEWCDRNRIATRDE